MFRGRLFTACLVATISSGYALAQANITTVPTAYIYVDAVNGSDGNSGSIISPLQTIQAAVNAAQANNGKSIGTDVRINPGIYREFVSVAATWRQTGAPMIFEAVQPGTAIISGSDVLTNWLPETANPQIYTHPWNYTLPVCSVPQGWPATFAPVVLRTEMIFVNGAPLAQVMSASDLQPGTFYINDASNMVSIWPSGVADISSAVVEASARPQTFSMWGVSNVIVRGLVFRHAASCINAHGADIATSSNILVDGIQAVWNNWGGLGITNSNHITVQKSTGSYNGGIGLAAMQDLDSLYDFNETDYNNWRGAMGALYDWGMGGTKVMLMHNVAVMNHTSYRNQAQGLWFDTDNKDFTVTTAKIAESVLAGLQLEANEGPGVINAVKVCSSGVGANMLHSAGLTIKNSSFYNNGGTNKYQAELFLGGAPGPRLVTDWETGQLYNIYTNKTTLSGNVFQDAGPGQYVFYTYVNTSDFAEFTGSLSSQRNQWYEPATASAFKIPGVPKQLPVPLASWRAATHEDYNSLWAPSSTLAASCAVPLPSFADFQVNLDSMSYTMAAGKVVATIRVGSFGYGAVTLGTTDLPPGVSASFSQPSLVSGISLLTLTAPKGTLAQTTLITIYGVGGGRIHPVTVTLKVVPATS